MITKLEPYLAAKFVLLTSVCLYVVSLSVTAFELEKDLQDTTGYLILLFGWTAKHASWMANPLYAFSIVFFLTGRVAFSFLISLLAVILSSPLFLIAMPEVWVESPFKRDKINTIIGFSGDEYVKIENFDLGYYLWFAAIILIFILSSFALIREHRSQCEKEEKPFSFK